MERRLVRRAELLWDGLRPEGGLPDAASVRPFLEPPLGRQAVLLATGPAATGAPPLDRTLYVGPDLAGLGLRGPGPLQQTDRLSRRLAALARVALDTGEPAHLDSDSCTIGSGTIDAGADTPALLVRAVALPFAPAADGVRLVVALLSWRQLLSAAETAALQRELATAIDWLRDHLPQPGK